MGVMAPAVPVVDIWVAQRSDADERLPAATGHNGRGPHAGGGAGAMVVGGGGGGQGFDRRQHALDNPPGPRHARLKESSRPASFASALQELKSAARLPDDLATAFDELAAWVSAAPAERSCWALNRKSGRWTCGLAAGDERFTAGQDLTLPGAIRNALMIAKFAGCP